MQEFLPHIEAIKSMPTPGQGFTYKPEHWKDIPQEVKLRLSAYESREIKRSDIIDAFEEYYKKPNSDDIPFWLTMIWGYGKTGYGNARVQRYYADSTNREAIKKALEYVKSDQLEEAFTLLLNIPYLGISFASKLLYFASRGVGYEIYPLIFDARVAESLVKLFVPTGLQDIFKVAPSDSFESYKKYYTFIHKIAGVYALEADTIEHYLYDRESNRKKKSDHQPERL